MPLFLVSLTSCNNDDDVMEIDQPDPDIVYIQADQTARPAINTVFNDMDSEKNEFNTMPPSDLSMEFRSEFTSRLMALNPNYTTNALGQDASAFTGLLVNDVLNVATSGKTTFFDGTNVLTGRALADDVIDVELLLIFGGPDGTANPGLTSDNVDSNDKAFSLSKTLSTH